MSTLVVVVLVAGLAWLLLFHKPQFASDADIRSWFSSKLDDIAEGLERDIEKEKRGEYPHPGKQTFDSRGMIVYTLLDKDYARFDVSDKNAISVLDIMETDGYKKLDARVSKLNLSIRLQEQQVEGDGVESFDELDEYIDDYPRYYTVTIGGW